MIKSKSIKKISEKSLLVILAIILVAGCMLTPATAFAQAFVGPIGVTDSDKQATNMLLNPADPSYDQTKWYDPKDDTDPYGHGTGKEFRMLEQSECFSLTKNDSKNKNTTHILSDMTSNATGKFEGAFTNVDDNGFQNNVPDKIKTIGVAKTVSFSPSGNHQKDHVAIMGLDGTSNDVILAVYNIAENKWSNVVTIGSMDWIYKDCDSIYPDVEPYMSITAGDYNGDGKDSIVLYFAKYCYTGNEDDLDSLFRSDPYNQMNYAVELYRIKDASDGTPTFTGQNSDGSVSPASEDWYFRLLNPAYTFDDPDKFTPDQDEYWSHNEKIKHMVKISKNAKNRGAGKGQLRLTLTSGDYNGDGYDDIAALSALEFKSGDEAKKYDYRLDVPYLGVFFGKQDETEQYLMNSSSKFSGDWVAASNNRGTNFAQTVNLENITTARLGKHSNDSIIIAGTNCIQYGDAQKKYSKCDRSVVDKAIIRYSVENDTIKQDAYALQYFDTNGNTSNLSLSAFQTKKFLDDDYAWSPVCLGAAYMNGKGNDPYILFDADIYQWKEDSPLPQRLFHNTYVDDDDDQVGNIFGPLSNQNFFPMASTCAGNWDKNEQGYEQIVYGLSRACPDENSQYVSYVCVGIKSDRHDPDTGLPISSNGKAMISAGSYDTGWSDEFCCTSDNENYVVDGGGRGAHGSVCMALCNIDYHDDGVIAKETTHGYLYSDPVVECVMQAAPYYSGTNTSGSTSVAKEFKVSKELSETNEVKEEQGYNVKVGLSTVVGGEKKDGKTEGGISLGVSAGLEKGMVATYKQKFSQKVTTTYGLEMSATSGNTVYVVRYPFLYYNYDLTDYTTGQAIKDQMSVTNLMDNYKITAQFSIPGYNYFVDQYNNNVNWEGKDHLEMKTISEENNPDLFTNVGNPYNYKKPSTDNADYEQTAYHNVNGSSGWKDYKDIEFKTSNSWEKQKGLHFHYDLSVNIGSRRETAINFNAGAYKDFQELWGVGIENSQGYKVKWSWEIMAPPPNGFAIFDACAASWTIKDVPTNYDSEGNGTSHLPVLGYIVQMNSGYTNTYQPKNTNTTGGTTNTTTGKTSNAETPTNLKVAETDKNATENNKSNSTDNNSENSSQTKPSENIIGPQLAFAGETDNSKVLKVSWNTENNSQDCAYQLYTCINGETVKVGSPVKGNEVIFDPNNLPDSVKAIATELQAKDWPIYQFAVSAIDENGNESPLSGWVYYCSSKYFKEAMSINVTRNGVDSEHRLSLLSRSYNGEDRKFDADSFRIFNLLKRGNLAKFDINRFKSSSEKLNIDLRDGAKYSIKNVNLLKVEGNDCVYSLQMVNNENSNDVKNFIVRGDDGLTSVERAIELEVLTYWSSPSEVVEAMNNPETADETATKLEKINDELKANSGAKLIGEAKDIFYAGARAYNIYYGYTKDYIPIAIALIGSCVLLTIIVALAMVLDKKKKPTTKSKYGTY